jgi:CxxC-x17-CxxC domain-containing protein
MNDCSTVLLINTLRATVEHLQESPEIDQASPGVKELERTLLEQIVRLQANHRDPQLTVQQVCAMEFTDKTLKCVDCGEHFVFSAGEQAFFSEKQFQHEPKHCKRCKAKVYGRGARVESTVTCAACGTSTIVPFVPRQDRPVLCRLCLDQKGQLNSTMIPLAPVD